MPIPAFLLGPLAGLAKWFFLALIIFGVLLGLERYVRGRGKLEAKMEQMEKTQQAVRGRRAIEREIKTMPETERQKWLRYGGPGS